MKTIVYKNPIDYMRGNLSGRQDLEYGTNDGKAYDQQTGQKTAANNYQPRLIAKVLRAPFASRRRYFQVRTKQSINMTDSMRLNLALMGGVGAIFAAIISDKTSQLYNDCVHACPKDETLRRWMTPLLRQGLSAKDEDIIIADGITIANPWVSGGSGSVVTISQDVVNKFSGVLGPVGSPYNAAATAALINAFPTTWQTIRDYGFAHPEIVGYMNAYAPEDAKIAYSLVEGIGTRWIANGGTAYFNLGFTPNQTLVVEVGYKSHRVEAGIFGATNSWSGSTAFVGDYYGSNGSIYCFYGGALGLTFAGGEGVIRADKDTLQVNSLTGNIGGTIKGISSTMTLFRGGGKTCNGELRYAKIEGDTVLTLYPFIRKINGVDTCGMIDVLSGTFYQNAGSGSFTISEEPA